MYADAMNVFKIAAVLTMLVAIMLGTEAWTRLEPAIQSGTIEAGLAVRVMLPIVALAVVAIWFWRQR